jgi:hypothetical protein
MASFYSKTRLWLFPSTDENYCTPVSVTLLLQCKTMLTYAINSGLKIPDWIGKDFSIINTKAAAELKDLKGLGGKQKDELEIKIARLIDEDAQKLTLIHSSLVELVAPATPLTIEYTVPRARFFTGEAITIPLIRNMWVMSILFLLGFIYSLYLYDSSIPILKPNEVIPQAAKQTLKLFLSIHLLFSAGLGAYFYSLYTANKYFVTRTFDPKYHTFYNNRIIIGIIAGFILANILNADKLVTSDNMFTKFTPSILALLGGYSADAVNKILARIVAMLTALVQGEMKDILETKENEWKSKSEANEIKNKMNSASDLMKLLNENKEKLDESSTQKFMELLNNWLKPKDKP